ncbi:uncharacterized protein LOC113505615 [Trichoplusia ni]|uniref:Uncharacterized protein LOC113498310 n=1 Tax=Trichoplusia ni TaxID=7111 RepID=A0A7E5W4Z5_TRINI|nr:uncharacterized protein LOC113498310 [Trichoplusia ni]XP_026735689.1 uncharacterized protein LOC113499410 [Trichoplusia ni]XP_026735694.1 uncharacterized protein LOC113499415 [Trichoplusia ni]XP_026736394.1 uncharacterized protein LOC113499967 [Trichoplusia ni]XP_026739345.1 uncharacterized protein LOC113502145 [Trichoplusia ni]XP_026744206.1 uncharacterized protein LOC113505615 [Trichoplusia ni]
MHSLNMLWCAQNEERWLKKQERDFNHQCVGTIEVIPDSIFVQHFRLNKSTFRSLCQELRVKTSLRGSQEISLTVKVLCALTFLATGSYQRTFGVTQHVAQRTASRCIRQVVDALNHPAIMARWIVFPRTQQERGLIKQEKVSKKVWLAWSNWVHRLHSYCYSKT